MPVKTSTSWSKLRTILTTPIGDWWVGGPRAFAIWRQCGRLAIDLAAVVAANVLAFMIRFEGVIPIEQVWLLMHGIYVTASAYALAFVLMRTYRSIWRYASMEDLVRVIKAGALGACLHAVIVVIIGWRPYPRSVLLLTFVFAISITSAIRAVVRLASRTRIEEAANGTRRVIIIGVGETGESIAREIGANPAMGFQVVGFIDDDPKRAGQTIRDLPVLGTVADLRRVAAERRVDEAIIALPTLSGVALRWIGSKCAEAGLSFKILPSVTQLVRGEGRLRYLRPLDVDDLLHREPNRPDEARLRSLLEGKRVMVTGAGGSIGSEVCRQVLRYGAASMVMVERSESALHDITLVIGRMFPGASATAALADVKHVPRMAELFQRFRPQIVFHAAAYKHVPILEDHPGEAVLNNVVGTRRLADVADMYGVETFVFISTDKAAKPSNLMGATKRICELYLAAMNDHRGGRRGQSVATRFVVVRFGNVLGSAGSVVPLFTRQIENGDPLTITDPDVSRFFMTIPEAVSLVLQSPTADLDGDVFVLDMGEPVKITQLADDLVASLGLAPDDVSRRFVGLRPGEKLHEVLWQDDEEVLRSPGSRIFAVRQTRLPVRVVRDLVGELERRAIRGDVRALLALVHEVIPSYTPPADTREFAVSEAGEKYRLLVVDDEAMSRQLLREILEERYDVETAETAAEGLEVARLRVPHLVVLDVNLPDGSGVELCRTLRSDPETAAMRVILVTGYSADGSAVVGLQAGADDYITKPFGVDELLARVEAVLRRSVPDPADAAGTQTLENR
jgi:FlaA1/EpsC-like NDP-sugar epimerase/ActR/RegA family two-component response regulator